MLNVGPAHHGKECGIQRDCLVYPPVPLGFLHNVEEHKRIQYP